MLRFSAIQTHPSCRFHLAVDFLGLRRSGPWSQITYWSPDQLAEAQRIAREWLEKHQQ